MRLGRGEGKSRLVGKLVPHEIVSICPIKPVFLRRLLTFVATIQWEKEPTGCTSYLERASLPADVCFLSARDRAGETSQVTVLFCA